MTQVSTADVPKMLLRTLLNAVLVAILAYIMPGIKVDSFMDAIWVSIVLSLLNLFIKPLIIILTLPVTIFTLGLFLLVINAFLILFCAEIVGGFHVSSFWSALFFSIVLSIGQSVFLQAKRVER
jgi:putative membrane protein